MKTLITALLISITAIPAFADSFGTVPEYQQDFEKAKPCQAIQGRRVWRGYEAFYIQSTTFYTDASGEISDDSVSAIPIETNTRKALTPFYKVCR